MRKTLSLILLAFPLILQAQSSGSRGPSVVGDSLEVVAFLEAVNAHIAECSPGLTKFKNLGQLQVRYSLAHALDVQNKECEKDDVPKVYRCLLRGLATKELHSLVASSKYESEISRHSDMHSLTVDMNSDIPGFFKELDQKLSKITP